MPASKGGGICLVVIASVREATQMAREINNVAISEPPGLLCRFAPRNDGERGLLQAPQETPSDQSNLIDVGIVCRADWQASPPIQAQKSPLRAGFFFKLPSSTLSDALAEVFEFANQILQFCLVDRAA